MIENRIDAELTAETAGAVLEKLGQVRDLLSFLLDLTPEKRKEMLRLGDSSRLFVTRSLDVASQHEDILPRNLDLAAARRDLALYLGLDKIRLPLAGLLSSVEDTMAVAGSEAFAAALKVYGAAKMHGQGEGLDTELEELARRFARKSKSDKQKDGKDSGDGK